VGILLAFGLGWVVGSRTGDEGFQEVVDALKSVRESEEFQAFVAALRSHLSHVATDLAAQLNPDREEPLTVDDVVARVRTLVRQVSGD
jgi:hypothetical protein